jgi:A/G-specific adenine glycosylase
MNPNQFSKRLLQWYDQYGRKTLPWRENISPYRVWISEIMLQQTQVKTVIPYFQKFIQRFPSLDDLADAHEDEVLHRWTGLGYYSRARNLQQTAKIIQATYSGLFPDKLETLLALPGIGRSTAGAILAIAFNQAAPILDGNVKRILTRFHAIGGSPASIAVNRQLWSWAKLYTPDKRVADYTQAIMDLGANVCTRCKPQCTVCPIANGCSAHQQNQETAFPYPKIKKIIPIRNITMLIFHDPIYKRVFLERRPPAGVWGGLWSFPECPNEEDINSWSQQRYGIYSSKSKQLAAIKHKLTHFQMDITPIYFHISAKLADRVLDSDNQIWYNLEQPSVRGFAAPVQRLLQQIKIVN